MQAIQTKYRGPTDSKGARVYAKCDAGRVVVPWDYALDVPNNHHAAACALILKVGWSGDFASGCLPDGSYAHVFTGR